MYYNGVNVFWSQIWIKIIWYFIRFFLRSWKSKTKWQFAPRHRACPNLYFYEIWKLQLGCQLSLEIVIYYYLEIFNFYPQYTSMWLSLLTLTLLWDYYTDLKVRLWPHKVLVTMVMGVCVRVCVRKDQIWRSRNS